DEYGQTDGLVAMEDILEEIVGNIQDEYDKDDVLIKERGTDSYVIDGFTSLDELEEKLDISFEGYEMETINGFMMLKLEHVPTVGEEFNFDYEGYNFKILKVTDKTISSVLVTKTHKTPNNLEENAKK
ncbi:MAG: HlyC/CorC family transporter, partial [Lachnospiraceae bacterium]|nr:HlyC/CorC family transporter [Lachnospiraceae bacterium]